MYCICLLRVMNIIFEDFKHQANRHFMVILLSKYELSMRQKLLFYKLCKWKKTPLKGYKISFSVYYQLINLWYIALIFILINRLNSEIKK